MSGSEKKDRKGVRTDGRLHREVSAPASEAFPLLVERALAGQGAAFSQLVEAHRRLATRVAYSVLTDRHLAADAVQEAFLKAFTARHQLRAADRFLPWFLAIVRTTATDMLRRKVRWGSREVSWGPSLREGIEAVPGASLGGASRRSDPGEALLDEEKSRRIRDALRRLPEEYREILLLKHLEGHSYRRIAQVLKTTVRAVESRLFRARQQLSRALESDRSWRPVNGTQPGSVEAQELEPDPAFRDVESNGAAADHSASARRCPKVVPAKERRES